MIVVATLTSTCKKDDNYLYQIIKITPSKKSYTRYFMLDKYRVGRAVDRLLDSIYMGDGENIFFEEKQKYRSEIHIKYEIRNNINIDLSTKKYHIKGNIPKYDNCQNCVYFRESKNSLPKCMYFRKFLKKTKIHCSEFVEKD